jgi:hypothetical protein
MKALRGVAFGLFVLWAQTGQAQVPSLRIQPAESAHQSVTIRGNLADSDVVSAPFSAVEESTYSQEQSDGTYRDKTRTVTRIARDSYGRTRAEKSSTSYLSDTSVTHLVNIFITDPLTDSLYQLNPENRIATRRSWKAFVQQAKSDAQAATDGCVATHVEPRILIDMSGLLAKAGYKGEAGKALHAVISWFPFHAPAMFGDDAGAKDKTERLIAEAKTALAAL